MKSTASAVQSHDTNQPKLPVVGLTNLLCPFQIIPKYQWQQYPYLWRKKSSMLYIYQFFLAVKINNKLGTNSASTRTTTVSTSATTILVQNKKPCILIITQTPVVHVKSTMICHYFAIIYFCSPMPSITNINQYGSSRRTPVQIWMNLLTRKLKFDFFFFQIQIITTSHHHHYHRNYWFWFWTVYY